MIRNDDDGDVGQCYLDVSLGRVTEFISKNVMLQKDGYKVTLNGDIPGVFKYFKELDEKIVENVQCQIYLKPKWIHEKIECILAESGIVYKDNNFYGPSSMSTFDTQKLQTEIESIMKDFLIRNHNSDSCMSKNMLESKNVLLDKDMIYSTFFKTFFQHSGPHNNYHHEINSVDNMREFIKTMDVLITPVPSNQADACANIGNSFVKHGKEEAIKPEQKNKNSDNICIICMDKITSPEMLKCGHVFCKDCLADYNKKCSPKCPTCGMIYGKMTGNQPDGSMEVYNREEINLAGYEGYGTLEINYCFIDGFQNVKNFTNPGKLYYGTERKSYLPDNEIGRKVANILRKTFDNKLLFNFSRNWIIGNDIPYNTQVNGGIWGYPGPTYSKRVNIVEKICCQVYLKPNWIHEKIECILSESGIVYQDNNFYGPSSTLSTFDAQKLQTEIEIITKDVLIRIHNSDSCMEKNILEAKKHFMDNEIYFTFIKSFFQHNGSHKNYYYDIVDDMRVFINKLALLITLIQTIANTIVIRDYEDEIKPEPKDENSDNICNVCTNIGNSFVKHDNEDTIKSKKKDANSDNICVLCLNKFTSPEMLKCGHVFCKDCLTNYNKKCSPKCPTCGMIYGIMKGNHPDGRMEVHNRHEIHLVGFESYGTLEINYIFKHGFQKKNDPDPGRRYFGKTRKTYLPDNEEGKDVLKILRKAFENKLLFKFSRNWIIWTDIPHKTIVRGGIWGYPDPTYLKRVKDQLATKGIFPDNKSQIPRTSL